jgi:hypothetical protein
MRRVSGALLLWSLVTVSNATGAIVRGYVRDAGSGEALAATEVTLEGTAMSDVTGTDGYFLILDVPAGDYVLRTAALGYESVKRNLLIVGDTVMTLSISLAVSPIQMHEVHSSAARTEFKQEAKISSLTFYRGQLRQTPFTVQSDLFRSMAAMPGIVTANDFSAMPFVRGGNADQNLVLLDGVSIYNPTHLGGAFSLFDPELVNSAELMTGGFPVEYGGRLSSVLDIQTRDGSSRRFGADLEAGLLGSRLLAEGPILKGDSSRRAVSATLLLSARLTYFDRLLKLLKYDFPYGFADGLGKAQVNIGPDTRLSLTGFGSGDHLNWSEYEGILLDWGNRLGSLNWRQFWNPGLSSSTSLMYNNYYYGLRILGNSVQSWDTITDWGLRTSFLQRLSGESELSAGLEGHLTKFMYNLDILGGHRFGIAGQPLAGAAFAEVKLKPWPSLLIRPGVRLDCYYTASDSGRRLHINPSQRVTIKYFLNEITALKAAFGQFRQYESALSPDFSPVPTLFFWVPLFGQREPQTVEHAILGVERWLDENTQVTLEGYYKNYERLYEMSTSINPDSLTPTMIQAGTGYSWGADLLVKRDWGRLTGWLSYSLGLARVRFNGREYPASYDRTHLVNVVLNYALPAGFGLSARWGYSSGAPYTGTVGFYQHWYYEHMYHNITYRWIDIPSSKNALRYPDYHRLDLGVSKSFRIGPTQLGLDLQVINVYDQKNILLYQWDRDASPPVREAMYQLPLLPALTLHWEF